MEEAHISVDENCTDCLTLDDKWPSQGVFFIQMKKELFHSRITFDQDTLDHVDHYVELVVLKLHCLELAEMKW